jgi:hypothetical protein
MRARRTHVILLAPVLVLAACSGGKSALRAIPTTTTTALLARAVALPACPRYAPDLFPVAPAEQLFPTDATRLRICLYEGFFPTKSGLPLGGRADVSDAVRLKSILDAGARFPLRIDPDVNCRPRAFRATELFLMFANARRVERLRVSDWSCPPYQAGKPDTIERAITTKAWFDALVATVRATIPSR